MDLGVCHPDSAQTFLRVLHVLPGSVLLLEVVLGFLTEFVPKNAFDWSLRSVRSSIGEVHVWDPIDFLRMLTNLKTGIMITSVSAACFCVSGLFLDAHLVKLHEVSRIW